MSGFAINVLWRFDWGFGLFVVSVEDWVIPLLKPVGTFIGAGFPIYLHSCIFGIFKCFGRIVKCPTLVWVMKNIRLFCFDKNEEAIIAACDTCHKCRLNICSDADKYPSVSKR
ncbi:TPA: hypothetical protein ACQUJH_000446 [Neisseria cinerea]|uniref:hypothetical protein n=1 Tax=Neisseria TaxID=482 RepID=UPI0027DF9EC7|nr:MULTISPECIES: hypothetical protein [Neisseria]